MINPIVPPPELVQQWWEEADQYQDDPKTYFDHVATQAAQWGADMELEACCEWLDRNSAVIGGFHLRIDRRPKPPSLKEQALQALKDAQEGWRPVPADCDIIRRALEALDD